MKEYLRISWNKLENLTNQLVEKIPPKSLDGIMCISSGGLVLGKMVSDKLELPLAVIAAKTYQKGEMEKEKKLKIGGVANIEPTHGNILLVDDLVHSGITMREISKRFSKAAGIKQIKTATLYIKPSSIFTPDYYVKSTNKWVVFPYETTEFSDLIK